MVNKPAKSTSDDLVDLSDAQLAKRLKDQFNFNSGPITDKNRNLNIKKLKNFIEKDIKTEDLKVTKDGKDGKVSKECRPNKEVKENNETKETTDTKVTKEVKETKETKELNGKTDSVSSGNHVPKTNKKTTKSTLNGDQSKLIKKAGKSKTKKKKAKEDKPKKDELNGSKNHLITEYYKVTRRKTGKTLKEEQDKEIIYFIENDIDDVKSLEIEEFSDKGRGIVTKKKYLKGAFICEYRGDLIDIQEAKAREKLYETKELGCYMYYFSWSNKQWCIDATEDTGRLGRLINHSRKKPNLKSKLFIFNNVPHLIFVALDNIEERTELLYDYGETNRTAMEAHPWIKDT